MKLFSFLLLSLNCIILFSCNNTGSVKTETEVKAVDTVSKFLPKPASSFPDTLFVNFQAAVFYHPDSLQFLKIEAQTDSIMFDGSMHEFFYQMRNARIVIKKSWPEMSIIEAKNYRYLLFINQDGSRECIDLDTKNDAYGLFVFNGEKAPLAIDMSNIETEVYFYLK
jgi:hypothetical protein